jgi:hypothetical protein
MTPERGDVGTFPGSPGGKLPPNWRCGTRNDKLVPTTSHSPNLRQCGCGCALMSPRLKRVSLEMNRDDKVLAVYPPHPEEGASTYVSEKRKHSVAPVSKDAAAHRSRVYPRSAVNMRKSGKPDLRVRDAAHKGCEIWVDLRSRLLTMRPGGFASASN